MEQFNQTNQKIKKPLYKKWWFWVLVFLLFGSLSQGMKDSKNKVETQNDTNASIESKTLTPQKTIDSKVEKVISKLENTVEKVKEEVKTETKANVPGEYSDALIKAETYAEVMHMSKSGIYNQLTSQYGENFPKEAAKYAVDNLKTDYKKHALEKAKIQ